MVRVYFRGFGLWNRILEVRNKMGYSFLDFGWKEEV